MRFGRTRVYVHGGVAFDPYKKGFEKLLGRPINYIRNLRRLKGSSLTNRNRGKGMAMVLNNGIFYEFVPLNDSNFLPTGRIESAATTLSHEVEEGKEYMPSCYRLVRVWRYLIGDVIRFTSVEESEIVITGRTKHFGGRALVCG